MPADLARRSDVELIRTGSWAASSGAWNPTRQDILAAVEAMKCPAVRRPRIKLGHTDERFNGDGQPALGWFENLRTGDGGHTLVADQVALPWLNQVQAAAYPDRSIEGAYRYRCGLGHEHPFVLTAVALLGVTPPAVSTLKSVQDLPDMLGVAAAEDVPDGAEHVELTILAADAHPGDGADEDALKRYWLTGPGLKRWATDPHPWRTLYALLLPHLKNPEYTKRVTSRWYIEHFGHTPNEHGVSAAAEGKDAVMPSRAEKIRHAWNASSPPLTQWVAEARPDAAVVVDDADPDNRTWTLYPVTWDGDEPVFGQPVPHDPAAEKVLVFASRADSRPDAVDPPQDPGPLPDTNPPAESPAPAEPAAPVLPAAEPEPENTEPEEEDLVSTDLSAVCSRLGLSDDADEQAILSALDALKTKADTPEPTPEMVAASAAAEQEKDELRKEVTVLASQVQTMSAKLAEAEAVKAATVKASVIDDAARLGKFTPADREQWEKDYDEAPAAVTRILASIAPGAAVPVAASGVAGAPEPTFELDDDKLTEAFFGPGSAERFKTQEA
jgi:hypothetical protein